MHFPHEHAIILCELHMLQFHRIKDRLLNMQGRCQQLSSKNTFLLRLALYPIIKVHTVYVSLTCKEHLAPPAHCLRIPTSMTLQSTIC